MKKTEDNLINAINSIVDYKYKKASQKFRSSLKERICTFAKKEIREGKNLTIQIFDKNAKSQKVLYMNREPNFFTILNIDI